MPQRCAKDPRQVSRISRCSPCALVDVILLVCTVPSEMPVFTDVWVEVVTSEV